MRGVPLPQGPTLQGAGAVNCVEFEQSLHKHMGKPAGSATSAKQAPSAACDQDIVIVGKGEIVSCEVGA